MRAKRISSDEQFRFIMERRQSGLYAHQGCQANDINPGTYNWISRLGMVIPCSAAIAEPIAEIQEVEKVDLIPNHEFMPRNPSPITAWSMIPQPCRRKILPLKSS